MANTSLVVRDRRDKGWFYLDNEYLNGYAKVFGPIGTAIYVSLCRHANAEQKCWPSMAKIAEENSISRNTITKYLKLFANARIISMNRERNLSTQKWENTVYTLLDKSQWQSHVGLADIGSHAQQTGMDSHARLTTKSHARLLGIKDTKINTKKTNSLESTKKSMEKYYNEDGTTGELVDLNGAVVKKSGGGAGGAARARQPRFSVEAVELLKFFEENYKEKITEKPLVLEAFALYKRATPFLKTLGLERMKELCQIYLTTEDKYYREVAWSPYVFLTHAVIHKLNAHN